VIVMRAAPTRESAYEKRPQDHRSMVFDKPVSGAFMHDLRWGSR
jgi:hypothetical protein